MLAIESILATLVSSLDDWLPRRKDLVSVEVTVTAGVENGNCLDCTTAVNTAFCLESRGTAAELTFGTVACCDDVDSCGATFDKIMPGDEDGIGCKETSEGATLEATRGEVTSGNEGTSCCAVVATDGVTFEDTRRVATSDKVDVGKERRMPEVVVTADVPAVVTVDCEVVLTTPLTVVAGGASCLYDAN